MSDDVGDFGVNAPDWMCITSAIYADVYINVHRLDYQGGGKKNKSRDTPALDKKVDEYLESGGRDADILKNGFQSGGVNTIVLRGKNFGARVGKKKVVKNDEPIFVFAK